jgi:hypothetical protein
MTYPVFASGDVFDASDMNAVGLWLVKSQAVGTGVSSVAVTGAFSAEYDNYLVTYAGGTMSADTAMKFNFGAAVTAYNGSLIYGQYNGVSPLGANDNNNVTFSYVGGGNSAAAAATITVNNPFQSQFTRISASPVQWSNNVGTYVGVQSSATSFTGFTLAPLSGTFTGGTIRVYGYRN